MAKRQDARKSGGRRSEKNDGPKRSTAKPATSKKTSFRQDSDSDKPTRGKSEFTKRPSGRPSTERTEGSKPSRSFEDKPKRSSARPAGSRSADERQPRSGSNGPSYKSKRDFSENSPSYGKGKFEKKPFSAGRSNPFKKTDAVKKEKPVDDGSMRLNRFIANSGKCSRREADVFIQSGAVTVNGVVVTELGSKVKLGDVVALGGETLIGEKPVYVLLNKPKNYITTTDDPRERRTVMMLVASACKERIYPVGRLDRTTTGLLLFTNDGEMAKKLTHPGSRIPKLYQVELDKNVKVEDLRRLLEGLPVDGIITKVTEASYVGSSKKMVGIQLHSGKNRIVRKMFETMGYSVVKLDRAMFAGLTKKDLPRGRYRHLNEQEIAYLKML